MNSFHFFSLDFLSTALAVLATICFTRAMVSAWPLSIVAVIIDFIIYMRLRIYGDASLQVIYLVLSIYGWWAWKFGKNHHELPITSLTIKQRMAIILGLGVLTPILGLLLKSTHSTMPMLDALTTLLSIIGQALLARKKIENWIVWFITDGLYILLYFKKGIPFHMTILPIYMMMALYGFYHWYHLAGFTGQRDSLSAS